MILSVGVSVRVSVGVSVRVSVGVSVRVSVGVSVGVSVRVSSVSGIARHWGMCTCPLSCLHSNPTE